jgi:hypothetical protein
MLDWVIILSVWLAIVFTNIAGVNEDTKPIKPWPLVSLEVPC